jgi:hypothetical protein
LNLQGFTAINGCEPFFMVFYVFIFK